MTSDWWPDAGDELDELVRLVQAGDVEALEWLRICAPDRVSYNLHEIVDRRHVRRYPKHLTLWLARLYALREARVSWVAKSRNRARKSEDRASIRSNQQNRRSGQDSYRG